MCDKCKNKSLCQEIGGETMCLLLKNYKSKTMDKLLNLLRAKNVFYDIRKDEFVDKKDPFVAPEEYISQQDCINHFECVKNKLEEYCKQLEKF